MWSSAREFVEDRLDEMDEAVAPCDLADEYDCSNAHMRHTLGDLVQEGLAERVDHGEYSAVSQETTEGESRGEDRDVSTEVTEDKRPSSDGAARLVDADDGTDGVRIDDDERADVDTSGMDQDDEYEQQLEEVTEAVGGEESDEIEADTDSDLDGGEIEDNELDESSVLSGKMILLGTVLLIVAVVVLSRRDDDESEDQQEEQQEDDKTGPADPWEVRT